MSRLPPSFTSFTLSWLLSLGLAGAHPLSAQDEGRLFVERLDVNVVNVEVFVTDADGNPVHGLTRDDFEVFEDGRPVEVTNFYTVSWQERIVGEPATAAPAVAPTEAVVAERRLNLVVFVDQGRMLPQDRRLIVGALGDFIEDRLADGDRVLLASYQRQLQIVQPFTQDRFLLEDGLEKLQKIEPLGPLVAARRRQVMTSMALFAQNARQSYQSGDTQGAGTSYGAAYDLIRSHVTQTEMDLRNTAHALESILRSMSGLPGRRALLYVGGGLPQRPGEELYQNFQDLFLGLEGEVDGGSIIDPTIQALLGDKTDVYDRIARAANANQVTLYTLDTTGSRGYSTLGAEHSQETSGSGLAGRTVLDASQTHNLREPLLALARRTGGASVVGTFNFHDGLAQLADDFETYYSLGYRTPSGGDGKYHSIEVGVRVPGVEVRHRSGYVDLPPEERVADRTLSSLLMDMQSNPLEIQVDLLEPREHAKDKRLYLPVLVRVPFSHITLIPSTEGEEGSLHFFIVLRDEEGRVSDLHRHPYTVKIPPEEVAGTKGRELAYLATLQVRRGRPTVAVGVWDELSGVESFVQKEVVLAQQNGR